MQTFHLNSPERFFTVRNTWDKETLSALFDAPFNDLLFAAQHVHRHFFNANTIQCSTLLSVKTGACPEDCGYCSQSSQHETALTPTKKLPIAEVVEAAKAAKAKGASRFCMGAAWRELHARDEAYVADMVKEVKALGLETCMTLGMLKPEQATLLKDAGLDYYNHNLDTSRQHYPQVISTRTFDDRLETLAHVRDAGIKVCCGGILGLGESREDRIGLLFELATLPQHPESVPINMLVPIAGTPLADQPQVSTLEWVKTIAVARLVMPKSYIRLSAGRERLSDAEQALCFLAGANSVFYGEKLLTTPNHSQTNDDVLFATLGLQREEASHTAEHSFSSCAS